MLGVQPQVQDSGADILVPLFSLGFGALRSSLRSRCVKDPWIRQMQPQVSDFFAMPLHIPLCEVTEGIPPLIKRTKCHELRLPTPFH